MENRIIMDKIKVCHVIYDLSTAGAQTVVMNYLRGMANDKRFEVCVLVRDKNESNPFEIEVVEKGYKIEYCDYRPWNGFRIIRPIVNWIRCQKLMLKKLNNIKPDIVHSHLANILPYLALPAFFSKAKTRFHTLHSDPYAVDKKYSIWTKFAINCLGFYPICVTEDQAQKAKEKYGFKEYAVIHNGLDIKKYCIEESKDSIRKSIGIPSNSFVIGTVGSLYSIKNIPFLINIFSEYEKRNENAFLMIVGDGVDRMSLESLCKRLELKNYTFLGRRDDVQRMYKAMDVFVLPSLFESSSIVTVEAQLSGVRVVISDAVPKSVIISDNVNRLSLSASVEEWIAALDGSLSAEKQQSSVDVFTLEYSLMKVKELYLRQLLRN